MLYLFNSGYRNLFRVNALNTLALPSGVSNTYRYLCSGTDMPLNIDSRRLHHYQGLLRNTPVAVIFIDRFTPPSYAYYPLRLATLREVAIHGNQIHFTVDLAEYLWPHTPAAFSERLFRSLDSRGIARMRDADPNRVDDGYYVVDGPSSFDDREQFLSGDRAWEEATLALNSMKAFSEAEEEVLFTRLQLFTSSGSEVAPTATTNDRPAFPLRKDETYNLRLHYLYPAQKADTSAELAFSISPTDGVKVLGDPKQRINGLSDTINIPLGIKKFAEDTGSAIAYSVTHPTNKAVFAANASLLVTLADSPKYWFKTGIAVLLFTLSGLIAGLDFSTTPPSLEAAWAKLTLLNFVAALGQACALFWVARLVGKKVL